MTDPDLLRLANVLLCSAAFGGLVWRLVGRWMVSYPLARYVVALFAVLELIVALGTARRAELGGPINEAQYAVTVHAVLTLVVIVWWERLLPENGGARR